MKMHGVSSPKCGPGVARARQRENLWGVDCSLQGLQRHSQSVPLGLLLPRAAQAGATGGIPAAALPREAECLVQKWQ